jgi:DNA-binding NtrC family response regulator
MIEREACRWAASEDAAQRAVSGFASIGNAFQQAHALRSLAITQWKRGKSGEALRTLQSSLVDSAIDSPSRQKNYNDLLHALILLHTGRHDQAREQLEQVRASLRPNEDVRPRMLVVEYLGDVDLEQGNAEPALALYNEALTQALALVPRGDIVAELRRRIAECHLLLGRPAEAKQEAVAALELCREIRERYDEAATYRVLALACAKLGQPDEAKQHFAQGFATFDDIETPYEWGKLWMSYGDWLSSEVEPGYGNLSHALEAYRSAVEHFERMEAQARLAEARGRVESLERRMREENEAYVPSELRPRPARRPKVNAELARRAQWALDTFGLVTRSEGILEMLEDVARVAVTDLPVLVLGESGTGKELIAQGVHRLSGRVGEFLAINSSAVPETMLESEFFGHMKGAFTNALADKVGLFEAAHEGTIFLDEVGEMSVDLQAKLLRYLETGIMRRVGGTRDIRANVRVIAATNRSRDEMQKGSGFRSDLYYRLAHAIYTLPPLRQRGDDVELLVDHYLAEFNRVARRHVTLSDAARSRLVDHGWPGNVRQLRSVIQKMVVSAPHDGPLTPREVPLEGSAEAPANLNEELDAQERASIEVALRETRGNKTKAANLLNLRRTSLIAKMKRLGLMR